MKLILLCFLVAICGLGQAIIKEHLYISSSRHWYNAQWFCRQYYSDLSTFSTEEEQQRIVEIFDNGYEDVWIGLNRQNVYSDWQWSDAEQVSFSTWSSSYPINDLWLIRKHYEGKHCAYLYQGQWQNDFWWAGKPFYCYRHLILVNKTNTWEEALNYCTTHYTGLASLPYATQVNQATLELALTQTDNVWTGLYFMDGKWLWLSGETPVNLDSLTSCPARPYHCGAFNKTFTLENRDCNEKLNFLCYQK